MKSTLRLTGAALALAALLVALACTVAPIPSHAAPQTSTATSAYVRLVNAAPAHTSVDVYLDNQSHPVQSGLAFGTVTSYLTIPNGSHTLAVTTAGQPRSPALATTTLHATAGQSFTVAVLGTSASQAELATFSDDLTIASGMAKLRVYHLSPDAGASHVVLLSGQTIIPDITYKSASFYLTLKPGTYNLNVVVDSTGQSVPLTATLQPNTLTSVFGVGLLHGTSGGSPTAFKFVVAMTSAMPAGLPATGFDPHLSRTNLAPAVGWLLVLIGGLALLWGTSVAMRRPRLAPTSGKTRGPRRNYRSRAHRVRT